MKGCIYCGRGFHDQCKKCKRGKCHDSVSNPRGKSGGVVRPKRAAKSGRDGFKDPKSTGRKRAAKLYPLDPAKDCEWKGLKNCGGGRFPIIGCWRGKQRHRHHGPVKDPLINHEGNVHRICTDCHIRWHELNDVDYEESAAWLQPHQPIPATDLEAVQYELDWKSGEIGKKYVLKSSLEGVAKRKLAPTED